MKKDIKYHNQKIACVRRQLFKTGFTIIFTIESVSDRQGLVPEEAILLFVDKYSSIRTWAISMLFAISHSTFSVRRTKNLCILFVSKTCSYMKQMIIENMWNFIDCFCRKLSWIRIFQHLNVRNSFLYSWKSLNT